MTAPPPLGVRLGIGRRAAVYAVEGGALKLYQADEPAVSAFSEAANMAAASAAGVPVPEVHAVGRFHERWGVLMSRCDGPSFADRLRAPGADPAALLAAMVALQRSIHERRGDRLPHLLSRLRRRIELAEALHEGERHALLDALARLGPGRCRLCHGDFHPGNILGPSGRPTVIDWVDAAAGDPGADASRSYLLLRMVSRDLAGSYLDAYATSPAQRETVLRWLPFVAAARLAEGIEAEVEDLMRLARRGGI